MGGRARTGLLLVVVLWFVGSGCAPTEAEHRALTSEIRAAFRLEPTDDRLPYATFEEIIPDNVAPDSVVMLLSPIKHVVRGEHWVTGRNTGDVPFMAHILWLGLGRKKQLRIAFIYYGGRFSRVDAPEYLGRTERMDRDSEPRRIGARAT